MLLEFSGTLSSLVKLDPRFLKEGTLRQSRWAGESLEGSGEPGHGNQWVAIGNSGLWLAQRLLTRWHEGLCSLKSLELGCGMMSASHPTHPQLLWSGR